MDAKKKNNSPKQMSVMEKMHMVLHDFQKPVEERKAKEFRTKSSL